MNPYFLVSKQVNLAASGDAGGGDKVIVQLPVSEPYRDYVAWFIGNISSGGNVTAQPILTNGLGLNVNDGNQTSLTHASSFFLKLCQQTANEIRPPSQGIQKFPGDGAPVPAMLSAVLFSNQTANPERFGVMLCAVNASKG